MLSLISIWYFSMRTNCTPIFLKKWILLNDIELAINRFREFSILGPVIGESHYTLPKINQNYKQDRNIPNFQKIENIPFEKTWQIFSPMHSQMKRDLTKVKWNVMKVKWIKKVSIRRCKIERLRVEYLCLVISVCLIAMFY